MADYDEPEGNAAGRSLRPSVATAALPRYHPRIRSIGRSPFQYYFALRAGETRLRPRGLGILSKPAADSSPLYVDSLIGQELLEIFEDKLALTGPSRATTADCGFVIKVYIPATRRKTVEMCKLSRHTDNESLYNQLKTHAMKTSRGRLYVTCAVLPDALEGFVEVLLQLPSHWRGVAGATIYGLITARIERFDIGSTLFIKDFKEAVALEEASPLHIKEGYIRVMVPLMRSILAAPIGEYIHVKGKVQVCGYDDMPITIDHRILIDSEEVRTPWIKCGESLSAVRMWLRPIF
ncbi:hypothetical protein ACQ4PT_067892 [Festuca glaucescens]